MVSKLIAFMAVCAAVHGQELKPAIDNERVTVWDVTWTKGAANPAALDRDVVVVQLTGPHARTASFIAKGRKGNKKGIPDLDFVVNLINIKTDFISKKTDFINRKTDFINKKSKTIRIRL